MADPERTCVACRAPAGRDDLVRLVAHPDSGKIVVDLGGRLPGRGAWIHPSRACVERCVRQPGKLKVLHDGPIDVSTLGPDLRATIVRAALDAVSMAAASGALVGGFDLLSAALQRGDVAAVVLAADASPRTVEEIRKFAGETPFATLPLDRVALGQRIGKGPRAALGVRATRSTTGLLVLLRRLADLG